MKLVIAAIICVFAAMNAAHGAPALAARMPGADSGYRASPCLPGTQFATR